MPKPPKANPLAKVSTDDLMAELARRNADMASQSGKDWYYMMNQKEDAQNNRGSKIQHRTVWIVHKRFWHMNHHMDDRHIEHLLKLPPGIHECMESNFDFEETYEEAERMLKAWGYTPLPVVKGDDSPCWSALISNCVTIDGHSYRDSMHADTPEIKKAVEDWMKEVGHVFESVQAYRNCMSALALNLGCVVKWWGEYLPPEYMHGSHSCMMKKEVWDSLPPPIEDEDDD